MVNPHQRSCEPTAGVALPVWRANIHDAHGTMATLDDPSQTDMFLNDDAELEVAACTKRIVSDGALKGLRPVLRRYQVRAGAPPRAVTPSLIPHCVLPA